jgi:hypothetical protein
VAGNILLLYQAKDEYFLGVMEKMDYLAMETPWISHSLKK